MNPQITSHIDRDVTGPPSDTSGDVSVRTVTTDEERRECFNLRRQVFVVEQGLFQDTDVDEHDEGAVHLAAFVNGDLVGTVRCYKHSPGSWYGGRLAVRRGFRSGAVGTHLVRKAVQTMRETPDVSRFLATIQAQNVTFFERLGWRRLDRPFLLNGLEHQLMDIPMRLKRT